MQESWLYAGHDVLMTLLLQVKATAITATLVTGWCGVFWGVTLVVAHH
jgi:hypothetical protein